MPHPYFNIPALTPRATNCNSSGYNVYLNAMTPFKKNTNIMYRQLPIQQQMNTTNSLSQDSSHGTQFSPWR